MENLIFHMSFDISHLSFKSRGAQRADSCRVSRFLPPASCRLLLLPVFPYCVLLTEAGTTVNVISVRRFFALPLRVVLAASGFAAPIPLA